MNAFAPIPPSAALAIMDGIPEAHSLLVDLAQAGIVKGYARLLEIEGPAGKSASRDKRIPTDVWRRFVLAWKVKDLFANGTVRIPAGVSASDEPSIVAIGIRFDPASVRRAADEHGQAARLAIARPVEHTLITPADAVAKSEGKPDMPCDEAKKISKTPKKESQNNAALLEERVQLTKKEAADILNVSVSTLQKLINQGTLETTNTLRRVHVPVASVKKHLGL